MSSVMQSGSAAARVPGLQLDHDYIYTCVAIALHNRVLIRMQATQKNKARKSYNRIYATRALVSRSEARSDAAATIQSQIQ
jgi:hypothetical protein